MTRRRAATLSSRAPQPVPVADTFDIYQTKAGYVAVQTELQRSVLAALQLGQRSFADLVQATGKSKPSVSAVLSELVAKGFVQETVPPEDRRRRNYTALAKRIGSSDMPLPDLRKAVQGYVRATAGAGYALPAVLRALSSATKAPAAALYEQGAALGRLAAEADPPGTEAWTALAKHLEAAGVGRMVAIDLRAGSLHLELAGLDAARCAPILAGFAQGYGFPRSKVRGEAVDGTVVRLRVA